MQVVQRVAHSPTRNTPSISSLYFLRIRSRSRGFLETRVITTSTCHVSLVGLGSFLLLSNHPAARRFSLFMDISQLAKTGICSPSGAGRFSQLPLRTETGKLSMRKCTAALPSPLICWCLRCVASRARHQNPLHGDWVRGAPCAQVSVYLFSDPQNWTCGDHRWGKLTLQPVPYDT